MTADTGVTTLTDWLIAAGDHEILQAAAIIAGTFILEDATTLAVALLVADGSLAMPVALAGLYSGIILGDLWLYGMGRWAASHRRADQLARHRRLAPFRAWLDSRMIETVFAVRFVPGLRLPTYTAAGFFRLPLRRFLLAVVAATTIWTTGLFFGAFYLGAATAETLGPWRWAVATLIVGGILLIGKRNADKFALKGAQSDPKVSPAEGSKRE